MGGAVDEQPDISGETSARALDAATCAALSAEIDAAKANGWSQEDLRAWFGRQGVELSLYLAGKRGEEVPHEVAAVLVQVSITGLPHRPANPALADDYADLPQSMKDARRWLLWRSEVDLDPDAKPRKVPYYANGERRRGALDGPEDVARLATFDEAVAALTSNYTGLGFALGQDETGRHWQGIDLDHLDSHPGLRFVAESLPGYTEKSPSGKGVHAIGYGRNFRALAPNTTGIEAYAHGRFFTVTGESVGMGDIVCVADFVENRLGPLHRPAPQDTTVETGASGSLAGALAQRDLRSALASMRADDRDLWIRMGHALKPLGDIGRGLWIEWSQTSDKYDAADASRVWDSFHPTGTNYQAVFAEAQRGGWANPASESAPEPQRTPQDVIAQVRAEQQQSAPEPEAEDEAPSKPGGPFRASELTGEPPERQWIVPEWIVEGAVNSLYGDGGVGKTLLAQQLACSVSLGATWLGLPTKRGSVLAVLCEDEKDELWRRHNHIKAAMGYAVGNPFSDVWLWPRVGDENVLVKWTRDGEAALGAFYADVVRQVEELSPSLLILDTLADVYGGNEIDRPQVNYFVKTVLGGLVKARGLAGKPLTVLLLGHPSVAGKASGSGYSGSTAWNNAVRSRMYLEKPKGGEDSPAPADERTLTRGKANYAASGDETALRLFFADGVLHATQDVEDTDSILWAAKRDITGLVDRAWNAGEPFSGQKTHRRYIHTTLVTEMLRGGFETATVRQALRELVDDGVVYLDKGRDKRGYRSSKNGS